jgi:hypothetical protein
MNRILTLLLIIFISAGCRNHNKVKRVAIARAGDAVLYKDQIVGFVPAGTSVADSTVMIQNYINKWARRELLFRKAEENLTPELRKDIDSQLEEARVNLVIYQYQRQMIFERMDTTVTDSELENYYMNNRESFNLSSNIVKALFIKIPVETPGINRIRILARSNDQGDLQQLETLCYQFAEKFDDFNEDWVPLDKLSVELPSEIQNEEYFLRRTKYFEAKNTDSTYLYLLTIRDYKLRSSPAPFEYVKDDIKRIIWNNRRLEFIQSLENGIYNDALKQNIFTILNK